MGKVKSRKGVNLCGKVCRELREEDITVGEFVERVGYEPRKKKKWRYGR